MARANIRQKIDLSTAGGGSVKPFSKPDNQQNTGKGDYCAEQEEPWPAKCTHHIACWRGGKNPWHPHKAG